MDTRVGFGATSILEDMCKEYILAMTKNGHFEGDVSYLAKYLELVKYNSQND